jgi:hypothetical protein
MSVFVGFSVKAASKRVSVFPVPVGSTIVAGACDLDQ